MLWFQSNLGGRLIIQTFKFWIMWRVNSRSQDLFEPYGFLSRFLWWPITLPPFAQLWPNWGSICLKGAEGHKRSNVTDRGQWPLWAQCLVFLSKFLWTQNWARHILAIALCMLLDSTLTLWWMQNICHSVCKHDCTCRSVIDNMLVLIGVHVFALSFVCFAPSYVYFLIIRSIFFFPNFQDGSVIISTKLWQK